MFQCNRQLQEELKSKYLVHSQSIQAVALNTCSPEMQHTKPIRRVIKTNILVGEKKTSTRNGWIKLSEVNVIAVKSAITFFYVI